MLLLSPQKRKADAADDIYLLKLSRQKPAGGSSAFGDLTEALSNTVFGKWNPKSSGRSCSDISKCSE